MKEAALSVSASVQDWSFSQGETADNELVDKVKAAGVEVNQPDKKAFIEASAPVYAAFASQVEGGDVLVSRAQALAK
ncbi:hypothetical protein [Peteryoungia algae]|uniref:hypothetical protein n=1 Tax=Peteryoungia algae TaxID=2919917 RepID=UPI0033905F5A